MFRNIKKEIVSLTLMLGMLTSFANASVPDAPGSYIGVTALSLTSVRINFLDHSDNEKGFIVMMDGHHTPLPPNDETVNSEVYKDFTGLICDKRYYVKVVAYNDDGNSSWSDERNFKIESTFGFDCNNTIGVPDAPGPYIGVTGIDSSSVQVNFLDNSDNEDGFLLFDRTGDINETLPENNATDPSQTYKTLTGLTCNRTYFIKALAFNSVGNSATTDERDFNIETTFEIDCNNTCSAKTDEYIYEDKNGSLKADILFIMDDSGSMSGVQNGVATSVSSTFGTVMTNFGIDWKATVIGTERGRNYLNKHINDPSINDIGKLSSQLLMGTYGGDEVGFLRAYEYLSNADITIRSDSKLSIVYISDEIAHSTLADINGIPDINDSYFVQNNIKVSSIIKLYLQNNSNLAYQLANVTGGIVANINTANYDILMTEIALNAGGGASKIELTETPCDINDIEVLINGVVVTSGWTYVLNSNSILFDTTSTIQDQDAVTVTYKY
jgi:hypothetical protein